MKILAVDTATTTCSVAVTDRERLLAEINLGDSRTHTRHLAGMVRDVCRLAGVAVGALDGYAVVKGPGSFTGLRIGVSTVKGLAEGAGRPIVGISSLRALAEQSAASTALVCPLIDARRSEVYGACYSLFDGVLTERDPARVAPLDRVLRGIDVPCTFIGNGAELHRPAICERLEENARFAATSAHALRAGTVARLAWIRLTEGDSDDIADLVPDYLRKSDARVHPRPRQ